MFLLPHTPLGSLVDFIRHPEICDWNKRHSDKGHILPWMTLSVFRYSQKWGNRTRSAHSAAHLWTAYFFTHMLSLLQACLESNAFSTLQVLIYVSPLPPSYFFFFLMANLLGGQHLKSLSEELQALCCASCAAFNNSHKWSWTRKSEKKKKPPPVIRCYLRLIDCYTEWSLNLLFYRLTGAPETWNTTRPNAKNFCFLFERQYKSVGHCKIIFPKSICGESRKLKCRKMTAQAKIRKRDRLGGASSKSTAVGWSRPAWRSSSPHSCRFHCFTPKM